jgi:transposase
MGRTVTETLVRGVTVNEVAQRHGVKADHLSSWRTLARKGKLVVLEVQGASFARPVIGVMERAAGPASEAGLMDLMIGASDSQLVHQGTSRHYCFPHRPSESRLAH